MAGNCDGDNTLWREIVDGHDTLWREIIDGRGTLWWEIIDGRFTLWRKTTESCDSRDIFTVSAL